MTRTTTFHSLGPFVYCPLCTAELVVTRREDLPRKFCSRCDRVYYHNPVPAAGGVIVVEQRVLLVRRRYAPRKGEWTMPAGFLEYFEPPEACAVREIREETGLQIEVEDIFGVYAGHDDPRHTAILILYNAHIVGGTLEPGDDALEARYFAADELPEDIAFEAHRVALRDLFGDAITASWAAPSEAATERGRDGSAD